MNRHDRAPGEPIAITPRIRASVIGTPIDVVDWPQALARITHWALRRESRSVCICNVHSVVTASQDAAFARAIEQADMATPDGAPVAWMQRRLGHRRQRRINGPDLMLEVCRRAAAHDIAVCLFGSTEATLASLRASLLQQWPRLRLTPTLSPPFRALSDEEDAHWVDCINASRAGIVFVSLGCPKQELWMAAHRGRVQGVMLGVGAAFDFHAGTVPRAPDWMRNHGLEWMHRLWQEPRRLWRRYLGTNSRFIWAATRQLLRRH